jgi:hypothetical protein
MTDQSQKDDSYLQPNDGNPVSDAQAWPSDETDGGNHPAPLSPLAPIGSGAAPIIKEAHEKDPMADLQRRAQVLYEATIDPADIPIAQKLGDRYRLPLDLVLRNFDALRRQARLDDAYDRMVARGIAKGDNSSITLDTKNLPTDDSADARKRYILEGRGGNFVVADNPDANDQPPLHELPNKSVVGKYQSLIQEAAEKTGVDARLISAIMFIETTHGWYDQFNPLPDTDWAIFSIPLHNNSILPMNVNHDYWGNHFGTREQLNDPHQNILAGARMLKAIQDNLPPGTSISKIATLYQDHRARRVSDYGARVAKIYETQPWNDDLIWDGKYQFRRGFPAPHQY